jgi:hypothetical protein
VSVTSEHHGVFNSTVNLSWAGLPTGVTASLVKSVFSAPGDGTTATTFSVASSAAQGTYGITLTATGGGLTQTLPVTLTIVTSPSCTLGVSYPTSAGSALVITAGQSGNALVSCTSVQGVFTAPLTLSLTGAPAGVTAKTAVTSLSAEGSSMIQVSTAPNMANISFNLSATATSGTFTRTMPVSVLVYANSFTLTAAQGAVAIKTGATGQVTVTSTHLGVFNSAVNLSWAGLPSGVTALLSNSAMSAPGDGTVATTFTVASSTRPGSYTATLAANGGGQTKTIPVTLTIAAK